MTNPFRKFVIEMQLGMISIDMAAARLRATTQKGLQEHMMKGNQVQKFYRDIKGYYDLFKEIDPKLSAQGMFNQRTSSASNENIKLKSEVDQF